MRFRATCYRAHDPRWAFRPLSGEGASLKGGRFNPIGTPALYLACTVEGCVREQGHGLPHRLDPLTICSYRLDVDDIVDLSTDFARKAAKVRLAQLDCAWRDDMANGDVPASWKLARRLIRQGAAGILVPSFAVGAGSDVLNVVLWKWGPRRPHRVTVHDPSGKLPKNMLSWL